MIEIILGLALAEWSRVQWETHRAEARAIRYHRPDGGGEWLIRLQRRQATIRIALAIVSVALGYVVLSAVAESFRSSFKDADSEPAPQSETQTRRAG